MSWLLREAPGRCLRLAALGRCSSRLASHPFPVRLSAEHGPGLVLKKAGRRVLRLSSPALRAGVSGGLCRSAPDEWQKSWSGAWECLAERPAQSPAQRMLSNQLGLFPNLGISGTGPLKKCLAAA
ncbi:homeobox protein Hox-C6 [Platysternon megacephalum]|uniref:Homeobox protein Hox-C6 n=1 Tax=Platysternon megacephalum TaxID=55544 RepID=A0A4D9DSD6_9SAUR|nr:homeobox protein Hox-C6 [Platysternon megacephalum]